MRMKQQGVGRRRKPEQRGVRRGRRPFRTSTTGGALLQDAGEDEGEQTCTLCEPDTSTWAVPRPQLSQPETSWRTAGCRWRRHGCLAPKPGANPCNARKQKKSCSRADVRRKRRGSTAGTEAAKSGVLSVGTRVRCGHIGCAQERLRATSAACSA